jgi:uncharacterized protein (TIGR03435 family)
MPVLKGLKLRCATAILFTPLTSLLAQPSAASPRFEAISLKYIGSPMDAARPLNGGLSIPMWPVDYKGNRLSGSASIWPIIAFACADLVTPYRQEPNGRGMRTELYQVEAVAPPGTSLETARAMLRAALAERLGFQYHIAGREIPVSFLERGSGPLKLVGAATDFDPDKESYRASTFAYRTQSASILEFAKFLTSVTRQDVIDRTGIEGEFQFNIDWTKYVEQEGVESVPQLASSVVKSLGLKLTPGKQMQKVLVIDHIDKMPTPN